MVFKHSDMCMLCVLYFKIIYKPSIKLFPLKVRAFLRNINIDRTTFYLLKHCFSSVYPPCILNTSPIQNDHLAAMELEGNMVEEVAEVK